MINFLNDSQLKWRSYFSAFCDFKTKQKEFYEKQKFTVSLEIKDDNIKTFLISKVYKLSEKFQMEDLSSDLEKIRVLKNQIYIGFKSLCQAKEQK